MFEGFRPKVIEEDIGHINLTNLYHAHGDDTDENESCFVRVQFQKARQKPHRKEADNRPEEDLEEAEDIPLRDNPILNTKAQL